MLYAKWMSGHYLNFMGKQPLVDENRFRYAGIETAPVPTFEQTRQQLPEPFWDSHQEAIDCWWKAWELAFQNIRAASPENGFIRNYIDTAFNGNLFLWDSVFILLFARYGIRAFNFQHTLDNFYARQHEDGFICRELLPRLGGEMFHRHDPASTGPNVLAWCEWNYVQNSGDVERIEQVFPALLAYHRWLRKYRTWQDGSYWSCGLARGMDNQPWSHDLSITTQTEHGHMSRVDSTAQALLSARCLCAMADVIGRQDKVEAERQEIEQLYHLLNAHAWDSDIGYYFDWHPQQGRSPVKSIGAYWTILAEAVPPQRLPRLIDWLNHPTFNRPHRIPAISSDGPDYQANGGYWRGGVWPPTNTMVLRSLTQNGYDDLAYEIACNHHDNVVQVYKDTGTLWEFYAPETIIHGQRHDGKPARKDMVGWGGLGPIAVLLEYRFGLRPNVPENRLVWDVRECDAFGVQRYPFGPAGLLDIRCEARANPKQKPAITVNSNVALELELRWPGSHEIILIQPSFELHS